MKNSTYQEMLIEYENDLDSYKYEREVLFSKYKSITNLETIVFPVPAYPRSTKTASLRGDNKKAANDFSTISCSKVGS